MTESKNEKNSDERDPVIPVLQIVVLAICVPFAPFVLGTLTEALLWAYLLARIPGITFVGGFWDAIGLSLVCSSIMFIVISTYRIGETAYLRSQGRSPDRNKDVPLEKAREELQAAKRPSLKPAALRLCLMMATLSVLPTLAPGRLNFDSPIYTLGVSFLMTVVFYLFMSLILAATQAYVAWFEKVALDEK